MDKIQGKRILFISPEFFGIDKILIQLLQEYGAEVEWLNERSVTGSFSRALNTISPAIFYRQSNAYYKKALNRYTHAFDIVFIIKGDMVTKETIALIREKNPNSQVVLYLYDPVVYIKGILEKISLYDRVISFEPKDCEKYGFEFRPLFCDIKEKKQKIETKKHYDICFYGTMYGDRFDIIYQLKRLSKEQNFTFYSFCFLRGKFMAVYYWLRNGAFRKLGIKSVSFKSKSTAEIADIINSSEIVLDANDILQEGLTLRTLETLISGKRMITTNKAIKEYDFYNPNNICVVDRKRIQIPKSFLKGIYEPVPAEVLYKYTAEGWIRDVFCK